ncbi:MAG TPA: efflux RND transporter periplasmic adaptor subunit, partial [Rubricoccaceae bacterium]
ATNDAALSPDVGGTLTYVAAVGTFVRQGATIAQVRATGQQAGVAQAQAGVAQSRAGIAQAQAGVAQAEAGIRAARATRQGAQAQFDLAQDQYRRQLPLVRDSILSALEFRAVETQLAAARAQVAAADAGIAQAQGQLRAAQQGVVAARAGESGSLAVVRGAQSQLANTRIVAPFAGVIQERIMGPGELASPGMPVVRIVSGGAVKIEAGVPERYAGAIRVGATVQVTPATGAGGPRGGRVTFVGVAVDPQTRTFPVEIQVDNSDGALKPAMVVRLAVTRSILENVVVVPQDAIVRDGDATAVMVAARGPQGGTVAERRTVELGPTAGPNVVLLSGVRTGESIVVSGQSGLAEGAAVRVAERRALARTAARPASGASGAAAPGAAAGE